MKKKIESKASTRASPVGHSRNLAGIAYAPKLLDVIIQRIAGGEALLHICKEHGMPNRVTVMEWLKKTNSMERYEDAVKARAHVYAEEVITIPDGVIGKYIDTQGNARIDAGAVAVAKLRAENRKWLVSKQLPQIYGDKVTSVVTGADGKDLFPEYSDLELARRVAFLLNVGLENFENEILIQN